jgi:hypothetical protein
MDANAPRTNLSTAAQGAEHFASGSNHAGEIRGLAEAGYAIGLVADRVGRVEFAELASLAGTSARVFVDSGAFSEVEFNVPQKNSRGRTGKLRRADLPAGATWIERPDLPIGAPYIAKPISDRKWRQRLATYAALAAKLGPQVAVVAPDCVAHQEITLQRMERYAADVRELVELGAQVLVPVQKGELSMVAFCRRVERILGTSSWTPAIPMMKDATSCDELEGFCRFYRPDGVHLLGIGPKSSRFADVLDAVAAGCATTSVQCDSALLPSLVGRTNGPGGGPRVYTQQWDIVRAELATYEWRGCYDADAMPVDDYTDLIADPDAWLRGKARAACLDELAAAGYDVDELTESPRASLSDWLADNGDAWTDAIMDRAWSRYYDANGCTAERKRRAVVATMAIVAGPSEPVQLALL